MQRLKNSKATNSIGKKVIAPGTKVNIYIGPLKPGRYPFFGEFNEKTARGVVIVE